MECQSRNSSTRTESSYGLEMPICGCTEEGTRKDKERSAETAAQKWYCCKCGEVAKDAWPKNKESGNFRMEMEHRISCKFCPNPIHQPEERKGQERGMRSPQMRNSRRKKPPMIEGTDPWSPNGKPVSVLRRLDNTMKSGLLGNYRAWLFMSVPLILALAIVGMAMIEKAHNRSQISCEGTPNIEAAVESGHAFDKMGERHFNVSVITEISWGKGQTAWMVYLGSNGRIICNRTREDQWSPGIVPIVESTSRTPLSMLDWLGGPSVFYLTKNGELSNIKDLARSRASELASMAWVGSSTWVYYQDSKGELHGSGFNHRQIQLVANGQTVPLINSGESHGLSTILVNLNQMAFQVIWLRVTLALMITRFLSKLSSVATKGTGIVISPGLALVKIVIILTLAATSLLVSRTVNLSSTKSASWCSQERSITRLASESDSGCAFEYSLVAWFISLFGMAMISLRYVATLHFIGDPISALWDLMTKYETALRSTNTNTIRLALHKKFHCSLQEEHLIPSARDLVYTHFAIKVLLKDAKWVKYSSCDNEIDQNTGTRPRDSRSGSFSLISVAVCCFVSGWLGWICDDFDFHGNRKAAKAGIRCLSGMVMQVLSGVNILSVAFAGCCTWNLFSTLKRPQVRGSARIKTNKLIAMLASSLLLWTQPVTAAAVRHSRNPPQRSRTDVLKNLHQFLQSFKSKLGKFNLTLHDPIVMITLCWICSAVLIWIYTLHLHDGRQKYFLVSGFVISIIGGRFFAGSIGEYVFGWLFGGVGSSLLISTGYHRYIMQRTVLEQGGYECEKSQIPGDTRV